MNVFDGNVGLAAAHRGGVIALGNFDGFHLGHQQVTGRAKILAQAAGVPAFVGTFDPHPARFFRPEKMPFHLTSIEQRLSLFDAFGMDGTILFAFNEALAAVSPEQFVEEWLVKKLGVSAIVTGFDYTFGRERSGTVEVLAKLAAKAGLSVEAVPPVSDAQGVISSTRIREALRKGDMAEAARLMSRPYRIEGQVTHGDKVGRTIGFPTANILMGEYVRPAYGVYAVRCRLEDGRVLTGAANIGVRPMFDPPKELLEVHLFDFAESLYDQQISVELCHYLRPEARFDGLAALVAQMQQDCIRAKELLAA